VLIEGEAFRIPSALLRTPMASPILRDALLVYALSFMEQLAQTALANGVATIDERLARWLLLADDRIGAEVLPLTHGIIAEAFGVRRSGITEAMKKLEGEGVVGKRRGHITILDRDTLEERASGIYISRNPN
jgi:CRP-like cAMP-binding protein